MVSHVSNNVNIPPASTMMDYSSDEKEISNEGSLVNSSNQGNNVSSENSSKNNSRFLRQPKSKRSISKKYNDEDNSKYSRKSPYYLTSGEHPGAQMVVDKLTGEENYVAWANSTKLSLVSRKKTVFINGRIKRLVD